MTIWAILPVKPLSQSKTRLAHILSPAERADLTQQLLEHTLQVLQQVPAIAQTLVVSRDAAVLHTAQRYHTDTFTEHEPFHLKTAVTQAAKYATLQGVNSILIIPADLPFLQAYEIQNILNEISTAENCIICPDEKQNGTNALMLPPSINFRFQYGPGSYQKHLAEAQRLKITIKSITTPGICFDLDTEADWHIYQQALGVNS
ncbi:MAG: 2-phospho-L-lactate guanylyltransferase [Anaerolineae bacterium]|nr:2-phospho-L-lactate guanylyltransferase [Anaerolineae bacterium]